MKTRDELAREYANFSTTFLRSSLGWLSAVSGFNAGFDAGFARAVEMLRSNDAAAARYADNFQYLLREGKMSPPQKFFADWLEKQQKITDEPIAEERRNEARN